ncbi:homeodomain protein Msx-like protein [Dinothrombium tinctorium]|uniref:Homeodomain protein Msx-like protein n=1 Tax=Dinothrombium tinctorium TaxID=1965070 RepID=A0A443Q900_9ACAR|nr:homeodomain protein Msx-like protein [Dinothrombium tinctorium]
MNYENNIKCQSDSFGSLTKNQNKEVFYVDNDDSSANDHNDTEIGAELKYECDLNRCKISEKEENIKNRFCFNQRQKLILEHSYYISKYVDSHSRKHLGSILNVDEKRIKNWFKNKRAYERRKMNLELIRNSKLLNN